MTMLQKFMENFDEIYVEFSRNLRKIQKFKENFAKFMENFEEIF